MSRKGYTWLETKKLWPLGNGPGLNPFHLPLQNHSALLRPLRPERLISRDCSNRLFGLWVCWDPVSGRHQQATRGRESQVQSSIPSAPSCRAAGDPLHFPSIGLSHPCALPLQAKTRGYCPEVLCLPLCVSLNSLGTVWETLSCHIGMDRLAPPGTQSDPDSSLAVLRCA